MNKWNRSGLKGDLENTTLFNPQPLTFPELNFITNSLNMGRQCVVDWNRTKWMVFQAGDLIELL